MGLWPTRAIVQTSQVKRVLTLVRRAGRVRRLSLEVITISTEFKVAKSFEFLGTQI